MTMVDHQAMVSVVQGRLSRVSSEPVTPYDIEGLALAIDTGDLSTFYQDDAGTTPAAPGDTIGKCGSIASVIEATANRRPLLEANVLNGLPALLFDGATDGTGDVLRGGYVRAQPRTVFLVFRLVTLATDKIILDGYDDPNRYLFHTHPNTSTTIRVFSGEALTYNNAGADSFAIWTIEYNGATSRIYKAGVVVAAGNAGTNAQNGITIGAHPYYARFGSNATFCAHMYLTHLFDYAGVLSDEHRNAVGSWLSGQTGLSFSASVVTGDGVPGTTPLENGGSLGMTTLDMAALYGGE